jgi:hypothetical protein
MAHIRQWVIGCGLPSRSSCSVTVAACGLIWCPLAMLARMLWSLLTGVGMPVRIALTASTVGTQQDTGP